MASIFVTTLSSIGTASRLLRPMISLEVVHRSPVAAMSIRA